MWQKNNERRQIVYIFLKDDFKDGWEEDDDDFDDDDELEAL